MHYRLYCYYPPSALDLITGEGIEILIPIGGFFSIVLTFLSSRLKKVEETNEKLTQKNDEIIKQKKSSKP